MKYCLTKIYLRTQESMIARYGDAIWELICDAFTGPHAPSAFTQTDVARVIEKGFGFSPVTARHYGIVILHNVRAESGDDVLRRVGNRYMWA